MMNFFKTLLEGERPSREIASDHDESELAWACLLVEAASMDGTIDEAERTRICDLLQGRFHLSEEKTRDLLDRALARAEDSVELHGFTSVIKNAFSDEERLKLIEMLWEVAYADGELHDYEASLLRRVGGLIYVSDRDRGDAHARVRARLGLD
ncbi:MAG: TerB family tellurite resistance protein [Pseudomonadota bacterium]